MFLLELDPESFCLDPDPSLFCFSATVAEINNKSQFSQNRRRFPCRRRRNLKSDACGGISRTNLLVWIWGLNVWLVCVGRVVELKQRVILGPEALRHSDVHPGSRTVFRIAVFHRHAFLSFFVCFCKHSAALFLLCSDFDSLDERDQERNNQLAFDVAEREFGICPCMTGKEMSSVVEPDKLSMVMYLSQFYEMFKDTVPPGGKTLSVRLSKVVSTRFQAAEPFIISI